MTFVPQTALASDLSNFEVLPVENSLAERVFRRRGIKGFGLDFALGALCVLGLAPFHIWPLALLGFGLLKVRLDFSETLKTAFRVGFVFGFGFFLLGMFWIGSAFLARGPAYIPIMPPMILGLALLLSLFWGFAGRLYKFTSDRRSTLVSLLIFASAFFVMEFLRGHVLTGFPWNLPGYIFPAGGAVSQSAAWIGIYGLTFLTFFMAACLGNAVSALITRKSISRAVLPPLLLCVLTLGGLWATGTTRLSRAEASFVEGVRLRLVQVQFDQSDQFSPRGAFDITNKFIEMSAAPGLGSVTHVIWPEGAATGLAIEDESLFRAVGATFVDVDDTPPVWIMNSLREEARPLANGRFVRDYFNSSVVVTFDRFGVPTISGYTDKTKLVPFGEFMPFGKWVEQFGIETLSTAMASISPAVEPQNARILGLPLASAQICYEIIFPGLTLRAPNADPKWILNQSNDAWYGNSIGPHQHFNQARYRAIEEGLPIVRSAANGFSGTIDAYGRTLNQIDPKESGVLDVSLPNALQVYGKVGFLKWTLLLLSCVILMISSVLGVVDVDDRKRR